MFEEKRKESRSGSNQGEPKRIEPRRAEADRTKESRSGSRIEHTLLGLLLDGGNYCTVFDDGDRL